MLGVPDELNSTIYPPLSPHDAAVIGEARKLIDQMHALNATRIAAQVRQLATKLSDESRLFGDDLVADANLYEGGFLEQGAARRALGLHPVTDHLRHLVTPEEEAEAGLA